MINLELLKQHHWLELWNPVYILLLFLILGFYLFHVNQKQKYSKLRQLSFICGVLIITVSLATPLHFIGHHYLFSMHMLLQSMMYLVAPPLILMGIPSSMLSPIFHSVQSRKLLRWITNPVINILLFNVLFSVYHIPFIFDAVSHHGVYNNLFHIGLQICSFMMWWLVICPVPELERLSPLRKIVYIFANGVLLTPACALIIFASEPLYHAFKHAPAFTILLPTPLDDQQLGGVVMKLVQEGIYGFTLAVTFYSWFSKERKLDKQKDTTSSIDITKNTMNSTQQLKRV